MVESALDRRAELLLKYNEKIIDGKGIAEKIRGELKQRIIARQLSKLAITMGALTPSSAWDGSLSILRFMNVSLKAYSEIV